MVIELDEIVEVASRYVACSTGMDFDGKRALWDAQEAEPILKPEELPQALFGWPEIDAYWEQSRRSMVSLESAGSEYLPRLLGHDVGLCMYQLRWTCRLRDSFLARPIAGDNRVSMLLRRKPEGWRVFHYVEAPLSLLAMAQRTARRHADEQFPA